MAPITPPSPAPSDTSPLGNPLNLDAPLGHVTSLPPPTKTIGADVSPSLQRPSLLIHLLVPSWCTPPVHPVVRHGRVAGGACPRWIPFHKLGLAPGTSLLATFYLSLRRGLLAATAFGAGAPQGRAEASEEQL